MPYAWREFGTREVPGPGDNPRIATYLHATSLGTPDNVNDETPWCSAFVNFVFSQAHVVGTHSALAASWLRWGVPAPTPSQYGDVVVLARPGGHHVAFCLDADPSPTHPVVWLLGGNQGDAVSVAAFERSRIVGVRRPGVPSVLAPPSTPA